MRTTEVRGLMDRQGFYPRHVGLTFPVGWRGHIADQPCVLNHDLYYRDAAGSLHFAPAGTETDGASIPRVFWRAVGHPFRSVCLPAAVIHDMYCVQANRLKEQGHDVAARAMRRMADDLFREGCRWLGAGRCLSTAYWIGVRCGAMAGGTF